MSCLRLLLLAVLALEVLIVAVLVWQRRDATRRVDTPDELEAVLSRAIPSGTPVDQAQQYLERHGFTCERRTNAEWTQRRLEPWPSGRIRGRSFSRGSISLAALVETSPCGSFPLCSIGPSALSMPTAASLIFTPTSWK